MLCSVPGAPMSAMRIVDPGIITLVMTS